MVIDLSDAERILLVELVEVSFRGQDREVWELNETAAADVDPQIIGAAKERLALLRLLLQKLGSSFENAWAHEARLKL